MQVFLACNVMHTYIVYFNKAQDEYIKNYLLSHCEGWFEKGRCTLPI